MNTILRVSAIARFLVILVSLPILSQTVQLQPDQPRWGDTLHIVYNCQEEKAKFLPHDSVLVVSWIYYSDGNSDQKWLLTRLEGQQRKVDFVVPEGSCYLWFHFITREKWDASASIASLVYTTTGQPARGGLVNQMLNFANDSSYVNLFRRELQLYPDSYQAYQTKWLIESLRQDTLASVATDIQHLSQIQPVSPELLYTLIYGYSLLGNEKKVIELIDQLSKIAPKSHWTQQALQNYNYFVFTGKLPGKDKTIIQNLGKRLLKTYPESRLARKLVANYTYEHLIPLSLTEKICRSWMAEQPDNPQPLRILARAFHQEKRNLMEALELLRKAINFTLEGKSLLYGSLSPKHNFQKVANLLYLQAKISTELQQYGEALAALELADQFSDETSPEYRLLRGAIWKRLGYYDRAEQAFLQALQVGKMDARDSLKSLYRLRHHSEEGFQQYFAKLTTSDTTAQAIEKPLAPDFEATSLDGKRFKLSQLRGKVVVLNFWFIGCAPCRIEIPGLNKLVEKFQQKDVVFLAITWDNSQTLRTFLRKHPFRYHIVPEGDKIVQQYNVEAFPTHIIINRKGEIFYRKTGGSREAGKELEQPLKAALLFK